MKGSIFLVYFFVYSIIMLYVGYYYSKKQNSGLEYFLGGRNIKWWLITLTFTASWFGPTGAVVSMGKAFSQGISSVWLIAGPTWIAIALLTALFAKKTRRISEEKNIFTLAEIFNLRYNKISSLLMLICVLFYLTGLTVACFLGMAKALSVLTNINWFLALILAGTVATIYTVLGGYMSVIVTDALQTILLGFGMLIFAIISWSRAGGWVNIKQATIGTEGYTNLFSNFGEYLPMIIAFGFGWIASQEIFQRFASAKDENHAVKGGWAALAINIPLYLLPIIAGLGAKVWLTPLLKSAGDSSIGAEKLSFWVAANALGAFGVFLFVAIMAAIMSSADTFINTASMSVVRDVYIKYFVKERKIDGIEMVKISRIGTLLFCIIAIIICFAFTSILDALFLGSDILVCGMLVPLVGAFWWKKATAAGATASTLGGLLFVIGDFVLHRMGVSVPWPGYPKSLYVGVLLSIILFVGVSLSTKQAETSDVDVFFAEKK